jgi:Tol biopolymer transport system component
VPKNVLPAKVVPFSGLTGNEDMPAFSPDGRQMAFAWNGGEADNLDVYVKLIGGGDPLRLTRGAEDEIYPTFSPDNRNIAFVRSLPTRDEVILIPAMGGAERRICSLNSRQTSVSFSPDGQIIAVVESNSSSKERGIFLVNIETGERRQLTTPSEFVMDTTPRFSPDGTNLAFLRSFDDLKQEIFVVSATGGELRQLTFDKTGIRSLAWSADSKKVFFASFRSTEQPNLWQKTAAGGEPELIATGSKNMTNIAASPDGRTVAFAEASHDENIWRMMLGAGWGKLIATTRPDHSPHVSPDGTRIVFVSDRTGHQEIWVSDSDGKNQRQLTYSNGNAGSPRFSPDGKFVAYDSQSGSANDIFIISSEGGASRRLTDLPESRNVLPAWSADGRFVYFRSNRAGDFNLWKMPASGGEAKQITGQGAFESFVSPDNKEIYYSKGRGVPGLWRVAAEGGEESPVQELSEAGYWRSWSMAANGIYFVARNSAPPYRIMFYDFSNKRVKEIARTEKVPLWIFSSLSVSEDGKTIFFAQRDQSTSSILLAELTK